MRQILYAELRGDLGRLAGDEGPRNGGPQNVSLIRTIGFDEREETGLHELHSRVYGVMFIRQLLCSAVPSIDIRPWLADVHKNGNDFIKSVALTKERYTDRCIQATGIGQYYFRHFGNTAFVQEA
jgi:hypothetical protein